MARPNINFNTFVPEDLTKSQIDWGTVASGAIQELTKIKKEREEKRSEFEDNTYKKNRELRDLEQYDNTTLNQLVISASGSAQEYLSMRNDMFKRNLISETQYSKDMDRISGNFTDFNKAAKNYDASYKKYQARIAADPSKKYLGSSTIEQNFAEGALAFGNLNGLTEYVNPTTGDISLVRLDEDGNISTDPKDHVTFSGMNNRMNFQLDKFNLMDEQKKIVDNLGVSIAQDGTIGDATLFRETAEAGLDKYVDGFMVKPLNVATVLENTMGNGYYTTTDLNDNNPLAIHLDYSKNNQPTVIEDERWAVYEGEGKDRQLVGGQAFEAQEYMKETMGDMIDNKAKAIRTKFPDSSSIRTNAMNDAKYKEVKVNMPDYTTKRQIGPNNSQTTGSEYVTEALKEEIGFNDPDEQILETYTSATDAYIPPKVQQYYNNKGQGLKTTYVDDSRIMPLTIGDLPEAHPDRVKYANQLDKQIYVVMHQPISVSPTSTPTMEELVNPYGTLLETEVFYNERSAGKSDYIISQGDRDAEYMIVDFAGRNLKVHNIRTKRSQPVWKQIQEQIINPAIEPYNEAEYSRIYEGDDMGGY